MSIKSESSNKDLIKGAIYKMVGVNKWQRDFMVEIIGLFLSIKGRINFLQLGRYGHHGEQHYRNQFEKRFDFMEFNRILVSENGSGHYTIAFDPSYINKSGKCTPGVDYFWSGCAGKAKWGLEIGGIAAIDINNHTAFHLEAVQTPGRLESKSLLEHYSEILIKRKDQLQRLSKYVVADAYFSKKPFVSSLSEKGFEIVSRFRDDANLRYLYNGKPLGKIGRPKKYDGKLAYNAINNHYLKTDIISENKKLVYGKVYSVYLRREVNIVMLYNKTKGNWKHKIYFSTDLSLSPQTLLKYYQTRFQIEFLNRDGKQHTALNNSQARSVNKLNFHLNISLTTINIAKIKYWIPIPIKQRDAFSMTNIKTLYNNILILNRFLFLFAIDPHKLLNRIRVNKALEYGEIAA